MRLQSRCWQGLKSSDSLTGGMEVAFPRWLTHGAIIRRPQLAAGRRPKFLTLGTSPQGCLSVLTIWRLASPTGSDTRETMEKAAILPMICPEVSHTPSFWPHSACWKWVTKYNPLSKGGELGFISWREVYQIICEHILKVQVLWEFVSDTEQTLRNGYHKWRMDLADQAYSRKLMSHRLGWSLSPSLWVGWQEHSTTAASTKHNNNNGT